MATKLTITLSLFLLIGLSTGTSYSPLSLTSLLNDWCNNGCYMMHKSTLGHPCVEIYKKIGYTYSGVLKDSDKVEAMKGTLFGQDSCTNVEKMQGTSPYDREDKIPHVKDPISGFSSSETSPVADNNEIPASPGNTTHNELSSNKSYSITNSTGVDDNNEIPSGSNESSANEKYSTTETTAVDDNNEISSGHTTHNASLSSESYNRTVTSTPAETRGNPSMAATQMSSFNDSIVPVTFNVTTVNNESLNESPAVLKGGLEFGSEMGVSVYFPNVSSVNEESNRDKIIPVRKTFNNIQTEIFYCAVAFAFSCMLIMLIIVYCKLSKIESRI